MLQLYMDIVIKAVITAGLRRRGIDMVTAQENGGTCLEDAALLDRLGLVNGAGTPRGVFTLVYGTLDTVSALHRSACPSPRPLPEGEGE
jgi:hypothetical protein